MTALLGVTAFKGIAVAELDRIEGRSRFIEPRNGTRIFAEGDGADAVYAIVAGDGCVRAGALDRSSKGLMVEMFRTGDIFGEVGVIDGGARSADATTEGRVRLLRIDAAVFRDTLQRNPALGANLCAALAARLRRTFSLLRDATFESLEIRLARQVLYLATHGGRPSEQGTQLVGRFRQSDLADLLGTTTRSIITVLNTWRADGLVVYDAARGQLTVRRQELARLVGIGLPED